MLDDFIRLIQFLVSLGLGPIDIVLVVVAVALYVKSEALDKALHECLAKVVSKIETENQALLDNRLDQFPEASERALGRATRDDNSKKV